jgi:probable phosphoglycerate mutase
VSATTIFLVRHASHDRVGTVLCGRQAGVSLGAAGAEEARRVAGRLEGEDLAAVYTSPLERSRETAEPIAAAAGVPAQTADDLHEFDYGTWCGLSFDQLSADPSWQAWNADRPHRRPPAGETLIELQHRMVRWLEFARDRHPGERVAAVSHGEPIKAALLWVLGAPFDALGRFAVDPASVSVVVAGDWGFKVQAINETVR